MRLRLKKGVKKMAKKKLTQCDKILKFMQTHKNGINGKQAYRVARSMNLPQRIYDLKKRDIEIEDEYVNVKGEDGIVYRVKQYRLVR